MMGNVTVNVMETDAVFLVGDDIPHPLIVVRQNTAICHRPSARR